MKNLRIEKRLDIGGKIFFLKNFRNSPKIADEVYSKTIGSLNSFIEHDSDGKVVKAGFDIFKQKFCQLYFSMKDIGFKHNEYYAIPVSEGILTNGAHRFSCAKVLSIEPIFLQVENDNKNFIYDQNFYSLRHLPDKIINYCFSAASDCYTNLRCAVLYPSSKSDHEYILEKMSGSFEVVYDQSYHLKDEAKKLFIKALYDNEPWVGHRRTHYKSVLNKVKPTFLGENTVRIIWFKCEDSRATELLDIKQEVRDSIGIGKHSIHITDHHDETIRLINLMNGQASFHWLNFSKIRFLKNFERLLEKLKYFVSTTNGLCYEDFIIVGSAVLSSYGIRDCRDIDIIVKNRSLAKWTSINLPEFLGIHNEYFENFGYCVDDFFDNQYSTFIFDELNFLSFNLLKEFKYKRGEPKDKIDLEYMAICDSNKAGFVQQCAVNLRYYAFNLNLKKRIKCYAYKMLNKSGE